MDVVSGNTGSAAGGGRGTRRFPHSGYTSSISPLSTALPCTRDTAACSHLQQRRSDPFQIVMASKMKVLFSLALVCLSVLAQSPGGVDCGACPTLPSLCCDCCMSGVFQQFVCNHVSYIEAGCYAGPTPSGTPSHSPTPTSSPSTSRSALPSPSQTVSPSFSTRLRAATANFSGYAAQFWTVPAGVRRVSVFLWGGGGQSYAAFGCNDYTCDMIIQSGEERVHTSKGRCG